MKIRPLLLCGGAALLLLSGIGRAADTSPVTRAVLQTTQDKNLDGIVITQLPDSGTLFLRGRELLRGEGAPAELLDGGLCWLHEGKQAQMRFLPVYTDGTLGQERTCTLRSPRDNTAPIARTGELVTYRDIPVQGQLRAVDPDADAPVFALESPPDKGVVTLCADGSFTYTPYRSVTGTDSFTFTAADPHGGVSEAAVVTIRVEKPASTLVYADLTGHPAHYAALRLAEEGIFTGSCIGGQYYLEPDAVVTRGEFLSMAVALSDEPLIPTVRSSFADDGTIPAWVRPFAVTALHTGVVRGTLTDEGRVLNANAPVTCAEAAVMLDAALRLTDAAASDDAAVPAWARTAGRNTAAYGILELSDPDAVLTRADAVQVLCRALEHRDS